MGKIMNRFLDFMHLNDYEEDDFGIDAGLGKLAQKITGFLQENIVLLQ